MTTEYQFYFGFTPSLSGFVNMEIDRLLAEGNPASIPVIRLYTWRGPAISFGLNQNPVKRLRIERCVKEGIEIVARPTGGREILHGTDLCCSVIWPLDGRRGAIPSSHQFDRINEILRRGLIRMGIDRAEYHSVARRTGKNNGPCFAQIDRGEISVDGKKIVASAQRIYDSNMLQQSSISMARSRYSIMDYLGNQRKSQTGDRIVNSVAYLEDVLKETFSMPGIVEEFKSAFEEELGKSGKLELQKIF